MSTDLTPEHETALDELMRDLRIKRSSFGHPSQQAAVTIQLQALAALRQAAREAKAETWDEGYKAATDTYPRNFWPTNPYRDSLGRKVVPVSEAFANARVLSAKCEGRVAELRRENAFLRANQRKTNGRDDAD